MSLPRVLFCLIFPPLAVFDRGCGSIVLVTVLTLLGWIPGCLAALLIILKSGPMADSPSSVPKLSMNQLRQLASACSERGPYEAPATDAQRDLLWRMGLNDTEVLETMGKVQATELIGSVIRHSRARMGIIGGLGILAFVFLAIALTAWIGTHGGSLRSRLYLPDLSHLLRRSAQPTPSPAPAPIAAEPVASTPAELPSATPSPTASATTNEPSEPASLSSSTPAASVAPPPPPTPALPRFRPGMQVVLLHEKTFVGNYGSMVLKPGAIQTIIEVRGADILLGDHNFQCVVHEGDIAPNR